MRILCGTIFKGRRGKLKGGMAARNDREVIER
jgi:hypothetical protein